MSVSVRAMFLSTLYVILAELVKKATNLTGYRYLLPTSSNIFYVQLL